uniref:PIN domain-containing protein n=1 Tax=Panagrolaimus sp. PS1159 TaxID=55785 RepID=A0AC35GKN5_9BILA
MSFYKFKYAFQPPYNVLLDGTFCQAALKNQINIQEQVTKYLIEPTVLVTTKCVLKELEKIGKDVYGAFLICKQFKIAKCPHTPVRSAAECLSHLARRSKKSENSKYIIATQDDALLEQCRKIAGIPLMSIRFKTLILESPSEESVKETDQAAEEIEKVQAMKKEILADPIYLIIGKTTGEAVFFPISRSENLSKFESDIKCSISAISEGDLRNSNSKEIVIIQSNGLLQVLDYPSEYNDGPVRTFSQQIYANVCGFRSYRYHEETDRLLPLNKWEMPSQISGWCIGFNGTYHYLLLSQCDQSQYVTIDFGPSKEVRVQNSIINDSIRTQLILSPRPQAADLAHCLAERIIIANLECQTETELRDVKYDICCAGALTLENGLSVVVTIDPKGCLLVYGWTKGLLQTTEPLAKCQSLKNPIFLCIYPYLQRNSCVCVSIVDVLNHVSVYLIDLAHIISV